MIPLIWFSLTWTPNPPSGFQYVSGVVRCPGIPVIARPLQSLKTSGKRNPHRGPGRTGIHVPTDTRIRTPNWKGDDGRRRPWYPSSPSPGAMARFAIDYLQNARGKTMIMPLLPPGSTRCDRFHSCHLGGDLAGGLLPEDYNMQKRTIAEGRSMGKNPTRRADAPEGVPVAVGKTGRESNTRSGVPRRPIGVARSSIGLVNVPVRLYTMVRDLSFSFRLLHKADGQPLKYERVCTREGVVIPWDDTVKGYEVRKDRYVVFEKRELAAIYRNRTAPSTD